jgi:dihydropteroate synthase
MFPAPRSIFRLSAGRHTIELGRRTLVMGILNCTPDSFFDGGRHASPESAVLRLDRMMEEGADLCDIGGESTRPGAEPVSVEEEWTRIQAPLREASRRAPDLIVSIDTTKAEVARRALEEGASVINDVSGLRFDPELAAVAARHGAAVVLMHMKGEPRTMQEDPVYQDVASEVREFLGRACRVAEEHGVARSRILVDPGIGFGKTVAHNLELIRRIPDLAGLGYPILIGASRKSFIGRVLDLPAEERLEGSLAVHAAAVLAGAHVVRVHDVAATVRVVRMADAIREI